MIYKIYMFIYTYNIHMYTYSHIYVTGCAHWSARRVIGGNHVDYHRGHDCSDPRGCHLLRGRENEGGERDIKRALHARERRNLFAENMYT